MDSEPRHIYEKLPLPAPRSTRLLTIVPGNYKDTIECTLEVVDLDKKPDYFALSYVWSPPDLHDVPPVKVICNGVPVEVTPNLGAALRRLRRPRARGMFFKLRQILSSRKHRSSRALKPGKRIWIDALCINQEDLAERSCQVSFMGNVYSAAENVIVWLGEDPGFGSEAMSLIRKVANVAKKEGNYDQLQPIAGTKKGLPPQNDKTWNLIDLFYSNPWFRRVWVIQEVTRENCPVIMGKHEMPLLDIGVSSTWMDAKKYTLDMKRYVILSPSIAIHMLKYGAPFLYALYSTSPTEASDARDKIYALFGIYSIWAEKNGISVPAYKPDYERPVPLVYADFVRYFLDLPRNVEFEEGSLRIMLRNESFDEKDGRLVEPEEFEDEEFPSWVPRWDQSRPAFPGLVNVYSEEWKPSRDLTHVVGENKIWNTLSLKGFEVSTISFLERGIVLWALGLTSDSKFETIRRILDQVVKMTWRYHGIDELKDALARTLTTGTYKDERTFELFGKGDLDAFLNDAESGTNAKDSQFTDELQVWYAFFTTANGYMGIGSRKMQIGDKICLFYGGEVLFILRPAGEGYRLVGECYVHGLMDGEAMDMLESGEAKEQWFDLV